MLLDLLIQLYSTLKLHIVSTSTFEERGTQHHIICPVINKFDSAAIRTFCVERSSPHG